MATWPLPTTLVGSLPRPAWLATPEAVRPEWRLAGALLAEGQDDAVLVALKLQEDLGLDIVTDGEQRRRHYIESFTQGLAGFDYTRLVDKRTRGGRYTAPVPMVARPVAWRQPVLLAALQFARAHTTCPLKVTIPGPMTIVDTSHDAYYGNARVFAFAVADAINTEARALAAAGADVIQIDEPCFNVYLDQVEAWGIAALDRCLDGVAATTAVHVCYGYGTPAVLAWKRQNRDWDQYRRLLPLLRASRVQQVSLEFAAPGLDPSVLRLLGDKDVLFGCVDVSPAPAEPVEAVAARLRAALAHVPPERLYPCTDCGMAPLPRRLAQEKLAVLVAAARQVRAELSGDVPERARPPSG